MKIKVNEFILSNKNTKVKWNINGVLFTSSNIPNTLLNKYILSWMVNQLEGIIYILTCTKFENKNNKKCPICNCKLEYYRSDIKNEDNEYITSEITYCNCGFSIIHNWS